MNTQYTIETAVIEAEIAETTETTLNIRTDVKAGVFSSIGNWLKGAANTVYNDYANALRSN